MQDSSYLNNLQRQGKQSIKIRLKIRKPASGNFAKTFLGGGGEIECYLIYSQFKTIWKFFKGLRTLGGSQLDYNKSMTKPPSLMTLICSWPRKAGSALLGNLISFFFHHLKPSLLVETTHSPCTLNDVQKEGSIICTTWEPKGMDHLRSLHRTQTNPWRLLELGCLSNQTARSCFQIVKPIK